MSGKIASKQSTSPEYSATAEALLNATAQLLSECTTINVSLSEIAKRSGVNSAMIKYHFGNKEGLLLAVLERDADRSMDAMHELVNLDWSARRKLTVHIRGIINAYYKSPYLNKLIHSMVESGSAVASSRVNKMFIEPMLEVYDAIIAQGVREGTIRKMDSGFLYYSLVGACDHIFHAGYSVPFILRVERLTEEIKRDYSEHLVATFLKGLEP